MKNEEIIVTGNYFIDSRHGYRSDWAIGATLHKQVQVQHGTNISVAYR